MYPNARSRTRHASNTTTWGTFPRLQTAFSSERMNDSVLSRRTASLYPLREWLSTRRNTCVLRAFPSASRQRAPLP